MTLKNFNTMTNEEKAKAYDEALERARQKRDEYIRLDNDNVVSKDIEFIFPELKESEDENIRRELIRFVEENSFEIDAKSTRFITWLEKQGEHANFRNNIQVGDKVTRYEDGVLVNLSQLERVAKPSKKQGEQKPAWSKEDEEKFSFIRAILIDAKSPNNCASNSTYYREVTESIEWLKSLKEKVNIKTE